MKKSCFTGVDNCLKPLLKKGVDNGVFSGAAVGLYKKSAEGNEKLILCHGKTSNFSNGISVNEKTLFDLASLTKPLCTVLVTLHLIEKKILSWKKQIDALFGSKTLFFLKNVTIEHLMSHSAGLKAYEPYYQLFKDEQDGENKKRLLALILEEKGIYEPGKNCVYSDLGYILLGELIERVSGEKIDDLFSALITKPLGLEKNIMYRPVDTFAAASKNVDIAATQLCPWRKRLMQGEVDDEHCWLMNGVSGHAGLFGSIEGVLDLTVHILNQWQGREKHPSYSNNLLKKALKRKYRDQTWCMGFDTPSLSKSSAGDYISRESVGHLGFTGTSFWIDPEKDMVIVLLTNRVHPNRNRNNEEIKQFRPLLHNTVFKALGFT